MKNLDFLCSENQKNVRRLSSLRAGSQKNQFFFRKIQSYQQIIYLLCPN